MRQQIRRPDGGSAWRCLSLYILAAACGGEDPAKGGEQTRPISSPPITGAPLAGSGANIAGMSGGAAGRPASTIPTGPAGSSGMMMPPIMQPQPPVGTMPPAMPPAMQPPPPAAGPRPPGMQPPPAAAPAEMPLPLGNDPVPSKGCGKADSPGSGRNFKIDAAGMQRTYIVAAPSSYDANKPHKLYFTWHYLGGSASIVAGSGYYGLQSRAGNNGIFVSPEGLNAGWGSPNDIPFAKAMLTWMKENYCIDETRIFSTGFSYGAIMSNRVGCEIGDQFRAIAPMSGSGPGFGGRANCVGKVAAWISHGKSDAVLSYSGGESTRNYWVMANGCGMETMPAMNGCVNYQGCADGYPVQWCSLSGGHVQPSFGSSSIWAFFSQF